MEHSIDRIQLSPGSVISNYNIYGLGANLIINGFTALAGAVWPFANRAFYFPFVVEDGDFVASKFILRNATPVSGNFDVGIYNAKYARLVSSGSTAHTGTNQIQQITITDTPLMPGQYFMALVFDNNTAFLLTTSVSVSSVIANTWGVRQEVSAFPLPATATPTAMTANYFPALTLVNKKAA
jgi:hypothetical protein